MQVIASWKLSLNTLHPRLVLGVLFVKKESFYDRFYPLRLDYSTLIIANYQIYCLLLHLGPKQLKLR
jgi:hypothetical protein